MAPSKYLPLLTVLTFGCGRDTSVRPSVIPRHRGDVLPDEARYISGLRYDPEDRPMAWLPNGRILVAHSEDYSLADVSAGTCEGSGVFEITPGATSPRPIQVGAPACYGVSGTLDPTAAWLVYSASTPPNNSRLVRITLDSSRVDTLPTGCAIYLQDPAVSPDGQLIAATGICGARRDDWRAYILDADGSHLRPVAGLPGVTEERPAWSPDGRHLVLARRSPHRTALTVVDLQGGASQALAQGYAPSWSPDGQWIAFIAAPESARGERTLELIRPDASGRRTIYRSGEHRRFSRGFGPIREGQPGGPITWSPDSRSLLFTRRFDRGRSVWRLDIAAGVPAIQVTERDGRPPVAPR
jgi:hypothetical protein